MKVAVIGLGVLGASVARVVTPDALPLPLEQDAPLRGRSGSLAVT